MVDICSTRVRNKNANIQEEEEERSFLLCHICGDRARGMNFNAITCMSCKMFFRRNALRHRNTLRCGRDSVCNITVKSRSTCIACRLKKCHTVGMKPQLIRAFAQHYLPMPQPLSLLRKDRSTLTSEQWNLLSNIMHIYDVDRSFDRVKTLFNSESSLPVKMLVKPKFALDFTQQCSVTLEELIKRSEHFQILSVDARRTSIKRNTFWMSVFQGLLLSRQINFLTDPRYTLSIIGTFGSEFFQQIINLFERMNSNEIIHKLMLFVASYFSNSSLVTFDCPDDILTSISVPIDLMRIQDVYITVLWKYLLYKYGFTETVRLYSSLITTMLNGYRILERLNGMKFYHDVYHMTVNQMEHSLIIEE